MNAVFEKACCPDKAMMHGTDYNGEDPRNWIVTEKFDGFFARWTGSTLLTREGHDYNAPAWFTAGLPYFALDCELFAGYGKRETLNSIHRWTDKKRWADVQLIPFDIPKGKGNYTDRHECIIEYVRESEWHHVAARWTCSGKPLLIEALQTITRSGGEGLVIRHPEAPYTIGRVSTMLKVKPEFINR